MSDTSTFLLEKSWMASNVTFVFPNGHEASLKATDIVEHSLGNPSERIELLRRRWMESITTIITHTFWSLAPFQTDFSQATTSHIWFSKVVDMYSSENRHYHTLSHLEEMFAYIDLCVDSYCCRVPKKEMAIINMAVFFHDLVYEPRSSTNEEDSSELFKQFQQELFTDSFVQTVTRNDAVDRRVDLPKWDGCDQVIQFILATKTHTVSIMSEKNENPFFLNLFLDADMSVLGKDENAYNYYSLLIRKEYEFVPHSVYCEKRSQVLSSFLSQPIFKTDLMRAALECRAQSNLQREIESLQKGVILSFAEQVTCEGPFRL